MKFTGRVEMARLLSIVLLSAILTGCVTPGPVVPAKTQTQIDAEQVAEKFKVGKSKHDSCKETQKASPTYIRFRSEIISDPTDANRFNLITNSAYPTSEQVEFLKRAMPEITQCRKYRLEATTGTPIWSVEMKMINSLDDLYIKLMKQEVTIGEANTRALQIYREVEAEWNKALDGMREKFHRDQNDEIQARRQAAAAMLPYLMQQQQQQQNLLLLQQQSMYQQQMQSIINNKPVLTSPSTTNCTTFGNQINCTTR